MARAFLSAPSGIAATLLLLLIIAVGVLAPIVWGDAAARVDLAHATEGPSGHFLLGTDKLGRDILLRTLVATQLSLLMALASALIGAGLGLGFGGLVAVLPAPARTVGERVIEVVLSFPPILVAIFFTAIVGVGIQSAIVATGIAFAPSFARLANSLARSVASKDDIAAARAVGIGPLRVFTRYVLPNIAETLIVATSAGIAAALIAVSALSFLGLGVQAPQFDWGRTLTEGIASFYTAPLQALAVAFAIGAAGLSLGFLGEAFAHATNPLLWGAGRGHAIARTVLQQSTDPSPRNGRPLVLSVRDLTVTFPRNGGRVTPVDSISFDMAEGEVIGIVGESGSGKSLTALAISRLVPYPGEVSAKRLELAGRNLLDPNETDDRFLALNLGMVFQDPMSSLNPVLTIGTQLTEGARVHSNLGRREAQSRAIARLSEVHIPNPEQLLSAYPFEFSGGMRQRSMIAMSRMNEPRLIIADEPTTALDVTVQKQIIDVLRELNRERGTAILLISHNIGVVAQICSRVIVMYAGRVIEDVDTRSLLRKPAHPYTRALIAAVPPLGADRSVPLTTVPGRPPDLDAIPSGCPFNPRCPLVTSRCRVESPSLVAIGDSHSAACWVTAPGPSADTPSAR